jgi:choline kinase
MIGVILAAGRGSRLGDATSMLPKPLMHVGPRACIDFALEALMGVADEIVVVTGYRADLIESHLATHWPHGRIRTVRNTRLQAGNLTSLDAARGLIGDSPFIVTNADHLFPTDMYARHFQPNEGIRIACERERPVLADEMKVIEDSGSLVAISKTLPRYDGAYIGTTAVGRPANPRYWAAFDHVLATSDLTVASVEMVLDELARTQDTAPQVCWISGLTWYEVDTPEDLAGAREGLTA